jgi:hypothetical protein
MKMKEKFWMVSHNADTTETGLPMRKTYIKTTWKGLPAQQFIEKEIMEDFCFERFGKKIVYAQGVALCPNWSIFPIPEIEFNTARPVMWDGYPTKTMRIELEIGDHMLIRVLREIET